MTTESVQSVTLQPKGSDASAWRQFVWSVQALFSSVADRAADSLTRAAIERLAEGAAQAWMAQAMAERAKADLELVESKLANSEATRQAIQRFLKILLELEAKGAKVSFEVNDSSPSATISGGSNAITDNKADSI